MAKKKASSSKATTTKPRVPTDGMGKLKAKILALLNSAENAAEYLVDEDREEEDLDDDDREFAEQLTGQFRDLIDAVENQWFPGGELDIDAVWAEIKKS